MRALDPPRRPGLDPIGGVATGVNPSKLKGVCAGAGPIRASRPPNGRRDPGCGWNKRPSKAIKRLFSSILCSDKKGLALFSTKPCDAWEAYWL